MWRRLLHRPAATHSPAVSWLDLSRLAVTTRRVSRLLLNVDDIGLFAFLLAHWYVISLSPVDPPPLTSPANFRWPIFAACTYSMQQAEEDPRRPKEAESGEKRDGSHSPLIFSELQRVTLHSACAGLAHAFCY